MKKKRSDFVLIPARLNRIALSLVISGFVFGHVHGADVPPPKATPAPKDATLPPPVGVSGSASGGDLGLPLSSLAVSTNGTQITDPNVIARVGKTDVTLDEMRAAIASLGPDQQAALASNPTYLEKIVRLILMERVIMNEIASTKWDEQSSVKSRLEMVRTSALSDLYLQAMSKPPDNYPSDAELQQAYDAHKAELSIPHQFLVSQIFVAVPIKASKDVSDQAAARLDGIIKELQDPNADFAAIAKKESDDKASAQQGGEMGWMSDDHMAPRIRTAAHSLAKGELSSPIRLTDGWHILKMLDFRDFAPVPLDQVKARLVEMLRVQRERDNRLAYVNKLLEECPVTLNDAALPSLLNNAKK